LRSTNSLSLGVVDSVQRWFSVSLQAQCRRHSMSSEYKHTQPMSRHGKKQSWVEEMQTRDRSQNPYDLDGLLSTPLQKEIKTHTMLPALPSSEDNYLDRSWRPLGLCHGLTEQFFRHRCGVRCVQHANGCNRVRVVRECRSLCAKCPVLEHCRVWAIETNLIKGFVAGMSEKERAEARKILKGEEDDTGTDYCD
jgi:hypothetical protein